MAEAAQIPFDLTPRPAFGRDDFLVAPSNEDAVAWIDRWPDWPAPCLIIYGPPASGKSHLAAVWQEKSSALTIPVSTFPDESADEHAAQGEHLAIGHFDPWIGDRAAETVLFHLYNMFKEQGRSFLLTLRRAPHHMEFSLPDLASRLRAAPAAAIHPPDDVLLRAVLCKLFADRQLKVSEDVLTYILPRMERSFDAARSLVAAADRLALAEKKAISIPLMRKILLAGEG